jgi:hypothetical protein
MLNFPKVSELSKKAMDEIMAPTNTWLENVAKHRVVGDRDRIYIKW